MSMSNEVIKILDDLAKRFGVVIDWTSKNVIPYVKNLGERIIKYNLANSIIAVVTQLLIIVIIIVVGIKVHNYLQKAFIKKYGEKDMFITCMSIFFCITVILIIFTGTYEQIQNIISCLYFPEKIIYETINGII